MVLPGSTRVKHWLQFSGEGCKAKAPLEYSVPSPVVIQFPPHTKTQTSGHSKFSQSKSLSELSHPLPKTRHARNTGRRAYHTSSSTKFHLCFPKKIYKLTEMCFTISTAGLRTNNLFVSAQLIYFLSPAADRLFYPLLPPMTLLNTSAARFVTTKLELFILKVKIKLWQSTGPLFPCCSNTKIFRQLRS